MPDRSPMQRAVIGGRPCVVHGLRAAQPGEGDDSRSPQPGQRWATGGRPDAVLIGAHFCVGVARLNALRSSRRRDTPRRDRGPRPRRSRHVRKRVATSSRSHRRHGACKACFATRHSAAPLRSLARTAPATSVRPWPPSLGDSLCRDTLGIVPRACVHPLRACTGVVLSQHAACAKSRPPRTLTASLDVGSPPPRIARIVHAPYYLCRARSRGFGRAVDITRCYAHTSCVSGAARGVPPREIPRPHNPSLCPLPASASLALAVVAVRPCTALPQRPARTALRCVRLRAIHGLRCTGMCECRERRMRRSDRLRTACRSCARVLCAAPESLSPRAGTRPLNRCAVRADREHTVRLREASNSGQHEEANRHRSQREVRGGLLVVVVAA